MPTDTSTIQTPFIINAPAVSAYLAAGTAYTFAAGTGSYLLVPTDALAALQGMYDWYVHESAALLAQKLTAVS